MFASGTSGLATTANHPARRLGPTSSVGASCSGRSYVIAHAPPVSHAGGRNRVFARSRISVGATSRATTAGAFPLSEPRRDGAKKPRIVVAGGGIGGLVFAAAALSKGYNVVVLERDLTAIRGEGKYRGPIQIQSNALATLEAVDPELAEEVLREGCITGDRINGLCDGLTGDWYCKFDTFHPAADRGIPVTRVISRMKLQEILAHTCQRLAGKDVIVSGVQVVRYENRGDSVVAVTDTGVEYEGDVLVGADGIWSKVREQMVGKTQAHFSGYTCYTGISDFCPPDIDTVGYRVFLGHGRYFVSSDVGDGKMQWYAFHEEKAGGTDPEGTRKERLMRIFGDWCDNVTDLIRATPEEDVLRRDIYDRPPIFQWVDGRVTLLGDAAHAMQPNQGQGGCMAIEDAFVLAEELERCFEGAAAAGATAKGVTASLRAYHSRRMMRAATIHGMARMAAFMASTYRTHLGEGMGPLEALTRLRIPHPGRMAGRLAMLLSMPAVLDWVLGGFSPAINRERPVACRLGDLPHVLPRDKLGFLRLMFDDDRLLAQARCDWVLVPGAQTARGLDTAYRPVQGRDLGTTGARVDTLYRGPVELYAAGHALSAAGAGQPVAVIDRCKGSGLFEVKPKTRAVWVRSHTAGTVRVDPGSRLVLHPGDELCLASDAAPADTLVVKNRHVAQRPTAPARAQEAVPGMAVAGKAYSYAAEGQAPLAL